MLNISISVKVFGRLFCVVPLHNIVQEVFNQLSVRFGFVKVGNFHCSVCLRMPRGIRLCDKSKVIPMLGNQTVFKTEDVKVDLFACARKIIDGVQKHILAIFKRPDVFNRCLDFCGSKVFD